MTTTVQRDERLLLTKDAAAALLSVSPRTLDNLRRRGRLRAVRIGTAGVRFDMRELRRFIDESTDETSTE